MYNVIIVIPILNNNKQPPFTEGGNFLRPAPDPPAHSPSGYITVLKN